MKKLKTPYLPALDGMDLSSAGILMETQAQREYIGMVNWTSFPYKPIAVFDIARTDTDLYIRYFVRGNSLKAIYVEDRSPVHKESCVEFFMQKEGDSDYMNFEFNCIGTCDAARRQSREQKQALSGEEYRLIRRHSSLGKKAFAEKTGLYAWELLVSIPFSLMGLDPENLPEKITGNFYTCADETEWPHYLSWSAIDLKEPDFHCPHFFGEIYL